MLAELTVAQNLRLGAFALGDRQREASLRDDVLTLFPVLGQRLEQRAGLLSGGQQQMLAIGRALMAGPRLLLLDEPSLGLAPIVSAEIAEALKRIRAQGTAILLADQSTALALRCTRRRSCSRTGACARPARRRSCCSTTRCGPPTWARAVVATPARGGRRLMLEVRDLTLRFGTICAFEGVGFNVAAASCWRSSVPTAPARARSSTCSRGSISRRPGASGSTARICSRCGYASSPAAASRAAFRISASSAS